MVSNPPKDMPRISPLIVYEDIAEALDFLGKAFGFSERMRLNGPSGDIMHAEVELESGVIMLGAADDSAESKPPRVLGGTTTTLYVYVDDVDRHFEQARAAGATVLAEPADQFWGDRTYTALDPQGHRWLFAQRVRDMGAQDMRPAD